MIPKLSVAGLLPAVPVEEVAESFEPVDLGAYVAGHVEQPEPTMLTRHGVGISSSLIYPGMVNGLHGDSGTGKSWMMVLLIKERLALGETVMVIDMEDTPASLVARLKLVGVDSGHIATRVVYVRPQDPFGPGEVGRLTGLITARSISVVAVDSLGEAFGLEGINENNDNEVNPWLRNVARRLADAGAAVVLIDHVTKAGDNHLHASGTKRKRAAIGGASYYVEAVTPFVKGEGGRLRVVCAKDRHGTYRKGEHVAWLDMTVDLATGETTLQLVAPPSSPGSDPAKSAGIQDAIMKWLAAETGPRSARAIMAGIRATKLKAANIALAGEIELMAERGALTVEPGPKRANLYAIAPAKP